MQNSWKSRTCDNHPFMEHLQDRHDCLRNRQVFLFGDSTIRQWLDFFVNDRTDPTSSTIELTPYVDVWEPRFARNSKLNLSIIYRAHGFPLQDGGLVSSFHFISNQLDALQRFGDAGERTTVVIAFGPHFYLYSPDLIAQRLTIIKKAADRLLARNKRITIIFKGTTTFNRGLNKGECCYSDWLAYRVHLIAKDIFDGTSVKYLDLWEMSVSHRGEDLLHPDDEAIRNQINMALSLSCTRK